MIPHKLQICMHFSNVLHIMGKRNDNSFFKFVVSIMTYIYIYVYIHVKQE